MIVASLIAAALTLSAALGVSYTGGPPGVVTAACTTPSCYTGGPPG
jgi:hypothetical protein